MSQFVPCHRVQRSAGPAAALRHRLGLLTFTAIAALSSGCGIGTVAAVAGLSDDNSSDPEQIEVLNEDSTPRLSREVLPEPALQGRLSMPDPRVRYLSEPTEELEVLFSKDVQAASTRSPGNVVVEVRRPTGPGIDPTWVPVAFNDPYVQGTRRMFIPLRATTQIDGLYRVKLTGIVDAEDATLLPPTTMYFVTAAGAWAPPEIVTFGAGVFGSGLRLTESLDAYSVAEAQFGQAGQPGQIWTSSILYGPFGGAWEAPRLVWQSPFSANSQEYETNTGGLSTTGTIGYYPMQEGNISFASTVPVKLRVPTAIIDPANTNFSPPVDFGPPVEGVVGGEEGVIDIGDPVTSPLLLADHRLSYSPLLAGADAPMASATSRLVASWWSLTSGSGGQFPQQGVYANDLAIDVSATGTRDWSARDWGTATHLSVGADHASWPYMAVLPDGSTVAVWWIASSDTDLLSASLGGGGAYQYAVYPPIGAASQAWGAAQQVATTGTLYPITEVRALSDNRLVLFTQGGGVAPEARILDPATGALSAPTSPNGTYVQALAYRANLAAPLPTCPNVPPNNNYGNWRSLRYASTPKASTISADEFIVRWIDDPCGAPELVLAIYSYDPATGGAQWRDLTTIQSIGNSSAVDTSLAVDPLGWVTLLTKEDNPAMTESSVIARRTNILANTLSSLATATPEVLSLQIPGTFARTQVLSNSHSTGAIAAIWYFGIGPISGENLRGTVVARFQ